VRPRRRDPRGTASRPRMTWPIAAQLAGFQLVWLACALGAASGRSAPGIAAAAAFLAVRLALDRRALDRRALDRRLGATGLAALAGAALGFVAESVLVSIGLVRYAAPWPSAQLAPAWIVALWLAFGATLPIKARLLHGRPLAAALLGALLAPLSYAAGARLAALETAAPHWPAYAAIALLWALALPLLIAAAGKLFRPS